MWSNFCYNVFMNTIKGNVFSLIDENSPLDSLTISGALTDCALLFSLGKDTDISRESYDFPSFIHVLMGEGTIGDKKVTEGDFLYIGSSEVVGKDTHDGIIYVEYHLQKENFTMTEKIKTGEVYKLKDLVPYQKDKVINLDVFHTEKSKLALISMAEGTALDAHKAPGEALLFILDGEATISYEGKDYKVKAGDNFSFAKGGLHALHADKDFKFALLLELC